MQYRTDGGLIFLAITMFVLVTKTAKPQQTDRYFFRHLTQEDGLVHNEVSDIIQDKKGFIWIATANGLQRYDGSRFLNFNDLLNDPSATHTGVVSMSEDKKANVLWINKANMNEGVDLGSGRITYYTPETLLKELPLKYSSYGKLDHKAWFISDQAIFVYDSTSKASSMYAGRYRAANRSSGSFFTDPVTGESWLGSDATELRLLDKKTMRVYSSSDDSVYHPLFRAIRTAFGNKQFGAGYVMRDSRNCIWIATWKNVFVKYDPVTSRLTQYQLPSSLSHVTCFYEDNHHTIWIGTENAGLLRYNEAADKFLPVMADDNDKDNNLLNYSIRSIFQDKEENIWLGSDKGIVLFNPYRRYFRYIHHEESNKASLPKDELECTIQTKTGDILVATWGGGITVYDSAWQFKKNILFQGPPEYNFVWSFIQNNDGTIWAGCQHGYIHIYDPVTGAVQTIRPPETNNFTIRCMARDSAGNIWLGLHNGKIIEWDAAGKKFAGYNENTSLRMASYPFVTAIFFDSKQHCWVSTDRGLRQFDPVNRYYNSEYLPDKNLPNQITANTPKGVEELNDSTLLVGTLYGGLNFFNTTTGRFTSVALRDSFLYKNIYAVKKDSPGYCWFTTDYGICRFKPGNQQITRYNIGKGIINASFKSPRFITLKNGDWVTNTETGVVVFNPGILQKHDSEKVEITGFKVFDAAASSNSFTGSGKPFRLNYNKNFITIEFARLRYSDLHQYNYYYRMKGINDEWINGGTSAFATYTNLPPGNYIFEVKADDGDGGTTPATTLPVIITPPFWKTWWFISLVGACIFYCLYRLISWRLEAVRTKEKLSLAKLEALRSQMNPHFIFNCLSSIDNLIQTGEKNKATTYLAKFARLIRSILETSKENTVPCWKDMETLALYLEMEALGCDMKFSYTLNIAKEITSGDYRVPPLIIQPFVENAIHHGLLNKREKDKALQISVTASKEYIRYTIQDNGVGRAKAMEYRRMNQSTHQSMGLQITSDRINLYNQNGGAAVVITDLYDADGLACGTKVEVNLINQS